MSSAKDLPEPIRGNTTSTVHLQDCMIGMASFPDKYFDLAVVDPPYGIREDGHRENNRSKLATSKKYHKALWDQKPPDIRYFLHLNRISKHQIIWGANHLMKYIPTEFLHQLPIDSDYFGLDLIGWAGFVYKSSPSWLVWDKNNTGNFADCELAYTSHETAVRKFKYTWNGMLQENMQDKEDRIHPTQKPIALYDWIYKNYLPNGGKVIDTHLGSGSNRIAAHKAGNIDFTAYEIDKDYYEAQEKRWKAYIAQTRLF